MAGADHTYISGMCILELSLHVLSGILSLREGGKRRGKVQKVMMNVKERNNAGGGFCWVGERERVSVSVL